MKLLNSKLTVAPSVEEEQLISPEQLENLYKQLSFYKKKFKTMESNRNSARNR